MKKHIIALSVLALAFFGSSWLIPQLADRKPLTSPDVKSAATVKQTSGKFAYEGKEGVDALTLLKQKASVEESHPGFVTTINGRVADTSKKEFWSFYVNGKMTEVGSAEYVTKNTDNIEWKIETFN